MFWAVLLVTLAGSIEGRAINVFNVFTAGDNQTHCFRIPLIVGPLAGTNTILVFAEARRKSCSDSGPKSIAMRRSVNGGLSWEPVQFIKNDDLSVGDGLNLGSVLADSKGKLQLSYCECFHKCHVAPLFVMSSSDYGDSWKTQNITDTMVAAGWARLSPGPATGVELATGRLVLPSWGGRAAAGASANPTTMAILSDDSGATWRMSSPMPNQAGHDPNEITVAPVNKTLLLANIRDAKTTDRLIQVSSDGGETWGAFRMEPQLQGAVCQGAMIAVNGVLFFSHPESTDRTHGHILSSADGGVTWKDWVLQTASTYGYSGITALSANETSVRLGTVFEADSYKVIKYWEVDGPLPV